MVEGLTNNKEKKDAIVNYESNGIIEYKVNLKENDFYNIEDINNKNIISKFIDSINVYFNYEFSSSKPLTSNATYSLKLYLINSYNSNNKKEELWRKEYVPIPETTEVNIDKAVMSINKEITIDFDEYNEMAKVIKNEAGVLTESYLMLEFSVNNELTEETKNANFLDEHVMSIKMPLLENITSIEKEGTFNEKETLYNISKLGTNYGQLTVGACLFIVSILLMTTASKMFIDIKNISVYMLEQNKILKRYGDVIAETSTKPDLSSLEVMEITNFIDLINIEDELRIPILFYETIKGKESWFLIIHNDKAYRYTLKSLTKSKKK